MQVWGGIYAFGLLIPMFLMWRTLLFMEPGEPVPETIVLLSVDAIVFSPFVLALCSVASTLNYTAQHHLGAFVRARCVSVCASWRCVPWHPKSVITDVSEYLCVCRRRSLYELAELEEAQAEASERWHQGAARQLRQLERALASAAEELRCGAAASRGLVEFLGLRAGDAMTLYGLGTFLCSVGGAIGLAYMSGQAPVPTFGLADCNDASAPPVDAYSSSSDHSHTCVCQWPGDGDESDIGSGSLSQSGSWVGN